MADSRTFVKLHDGLPDHPKVLAVGPEAAWLYVCGLCYCSRHLTDGVIPKPAVGRLAGIRRPEKAAERLVAAGLWHDDGPHFRVHDYLDHQRSAAEVEALTEKRREAGKRGGKAKANVVANARGVAKQNAGKPLAETEVETETTPTPPSPPSTSLALVPDAVSPPATDPVRCVFDAWVEATGRTGRTVLDPKRRRLITNALAAYPPDDVLDAVRGWKNSPHHRGENDSGTTYNDLELLLRNPSHIERFRDLWRHPPRPGAKPSTVSTGMANIERALLGGQR